MIPWALTIDDHTGTHTIAADTAADRAAAITTAADAVRAAILTAPTATATHTPARLTITIDGDVEFILGMSTDERGKLDRDTALDHTDRYEHDALDGIARNEAVGRGRAEPGE